MRRPAIAISLCGALVAIAAAGSAAGPEKVDTRWTLLSSAKTLNILTVPSVARDGAKIVVAGLTSQTVAEAVTFSPSATVDVVAPVRHQIVASPTALGAPRLLSRSNGELQALVEGIPRLGISFAPRSADGSFGPPAPSADNVRATVAGPAVTSTDGFFQPMWPAAYGGDLWLWRGTTASGVNPGKSLPGSQVSPAMGRDTKGRFWVTWYQLAPSPRDTGVYLAQFVPQTLDFMGAPKRAPSSGSATNSARRPALTCTDTCVVAYTSSTKSGARILTWAYDDRRATRVADVRGGVSFPIAAFAPGFRLWTAWWNPGTKRYEATRGDSRGAGGSVVDLGKPSGTSDAGPLAATTSGDNLVLVATRKNRTKVLTYVNVVKPGR